MTTGYRRNDLGRIEHDAAFVRGECETYGCHFSFPAISKAGAIRLARKHAAGSGHPVTLSLTHWQMVYPVKKP